MAHPVQQIPPRQEYLIRIDIIKHACKVVAAVCWIFFLIAPQLSTFIAASVFSLVAKDVHTMCKNTEPFHRQGIELDNGEEVMLELFKGTIVFKICAKAYFCMKKWE